MSECKREFEFVLTLYGGFDDFEFAAYLEPPLTTVKLAGLEMGRKAAQMLLRHAAEGTFEEQEVTFPATLVARASA